MNNHMAINRVQECHVHIVGRGIELLSFGEFRMEWPTKCCNNPTTIADALERGDIINGGQALVVSRWFVYRQQGLLSHCQGSSRIESFGKL